VAKLIHRRHEAVGVFDSVSLFSSWRILRSGGTRPPGAAQQHARSLVGLPN
jgi:hypothetical protein